MLKLTPCFWCQAQRVRVAETEVWEEGGAGGLNLQKVLEVIKSQIHLRHFMI